MRKTVLTCLALLATVGAGAQNTISLPAPEKGAPYTMSVLEALQQRESVRSFDERQLSDQQLATLLWATCGISRPESGKITAPSAVNAQDIIVYVCRADGVWLFEPKQNTLTKVSDKDLRSDIAGRQEFSAKAPVSLLLVADRNKMERENLSNMDAGYVSENIYLACTAMGLGTVARATMRVEAIKEALGLGEKLVPVLNHPVGFRK